MAVETDHSSEQSNPAVAERPHHGRFTFTEIRRHSATIFDAASRFLAPLVDVVGNAFSRLADTALVRFVSSSLLRRIIVSNLLGVLVLFVGVLYLSQFNVWLIDAKRESLQSQGRIIAGAIASSASRSSSGLARAPGKQLPDDNDPFAALTFSLGPERVMPVLRRLLDNTDNRARVYDRKGNLVADSYQKLPPGGLLSINERGEIINPPTTKNLWTKLRQWLLSSDLRVYKELGDANGQLYPEVRTALRGKSEALLLLTRSGMQIVSVATPIELAGEIQGVLLLSTRPGLVDEALAEERLGIIALALVAIAAAMLASYMLARTVAGPMRELSESAEDVTRNIQSAHDLPDFDEREDEVGQLARSFHAMTSGLLRRIEASEKFAADVAHELKNPLTAARSTAESLAYAKSDAQRDALVVQIQEELKRLNKLITDVSNASRMDAELALHRPEPVDLAKVAQGVSETFQDLISHTDRRLKLRLEPDSAAAGVFVVAGHEGRLAQVLTNLIDNALSFSPEDGVVEVRLRRQGSDVVLSVADQGPGIEPDKLETVFTRFYTYRPTAEGSRGGNSGLGLSISKEIIEAHAGEIWAENRSSNAGKSDCGGTTGACFVIRLAAANAKARPFKRTQRLAAAGR